MLTNEVEIAKSEQQLIACYPVMAQLRPHLSEQEFISRVKSQMNDGYKLAYITDKNTVVAVAGYRTAINLAWGKFLYVDDLVTDKTRRSCGFGKQLTDWLVQEAKKNKCAELHLDSGLQRKDAHRFYNREELETTGYHFARKF
ncbi:MAG: GNAT family N-acetyltransferase [Gammaproteobacteria bacterium]|nr:GNAT family N-acetyltransferase [Gammaproteobacteria bacterium]